MTTADLRPVNRDSTAGLIARQLRTAIMNGALPPGTQLGEADLAATFQVSRGPLREAMQRLVQEGLVRSERHRGLFVIDLEPADVYDIYVTRNAIEQAAARLVLRGDPDAVADQLAAVHEEMADAGQNADRAAAGEADLRFHEVLVAASGSRRLMRMADTLLVETRMCIGALQRTYSSAEDQINEHGAIVAALRDRDEDALMKLIDAHMEDAVVRLVPGHSLHGPGPARSDSDLPDEPAVVLAARSTPRATASKARRTPGPVRKTTDKPAAAATTTAKGTGKVVKAAKKTGKPATPKNTATKRSAGGARAGS
jgi:DNA-binding GntR family transcriptional regulator